MKKVIKLLLCICLSLLCCSMFVMFSSAYEIKEFDRDDEWIQFADLLLDDEVDMLENNEDVLPDASGVSTIASNETITENKMNIYLNGIDGNNSDFVEFVDNTYGSSELVYDSNNDGVDDSEKGNIVGRSPVYFNTQGACTDGEYYYVGVLVNDVYDTINDKVAVEQVDTRILCLQKNDDGSFTKVKLNANLRNIIGHANGLTYNSDTGEVVITVCEAPMRQKICVIAASKLADPNETVDINDFEIKYVSCILNSLSYNAKRKCYVGAVTGCFRQFAVFDTNFNLVKTIAHTNTGFDKTDWVTQSVFCDDNYIYMSNVKDTKNAEGKLDLSLETENRIEIYDWDGNYIKSIYINVLGATERKYEIESISFNKDDILLTFNCVKSCYVRGFYVYNLNKNSFTVAYLPDENVSDYITRDASGNIEEINLTNLKTSFTIYKIPTNLYENEFYQDDYSFKGWAVYHCEINKWYYINETTNQRKWCEEGSQPDGFTKLIYTDKQSMAYTAEGTHIFMCATWEPTSEFFVNFHPNDGTGDLMDQQEITHGTPTNLSANAYSKANRTFGGWSLYWREGNKWYYENTSTNHRAWYTEDEKPSGYTKIHYSDSQSVSQTVPKGHHLDLYAFWNEFYIFYDANEVLVPYDMILSKTSGKFQSGYSNVVSTYENLSYVDYPKEGKETKELREFLGWCLYRQDTDQWYCKQGTTFAWVKTKDVAAEGTTGWHKYVVSSSNGTTVTIGAATLPETTLVLEAQWSEYTITQ